MNWIIKPFSKAVLAWAFFRILFAAFITSAEADEYIAGYILLAAAQFTAMVFVWSHITKGDAAYTLIHVSVCAMCNRMGRWFPAPAEGRIGKNES